MKDALAIHRMLLERETLHEIVRLPRAIANADELPDVLGLPKTRCLSTRVYAVLQQTRPGLGRPGRVLAAVLARAGAPGSAEPVRLALGGRSARRATADLINKVTDYAAELVAPLLLPDTMPIFVDESVMDEVEVEDVVYTAAGEPWNALGIRALDLLAITGAKPIDLEPTAPLPLPR